MSFGGGSQYTLEYIIKVTNQGGTGAFNQVNTGIQSLSKNYQQAGISAEKYSMIQQKMQASHEKVIQGTQGITKAMKGLAFGVLGMATAGAEFVGMMSMWKQTSAAVAEAQGEVDRALKESGKNSKDYKDAINELAKANRWARMTFRNLMLSMFDMVPFFILTINGIVKLRSAYKALREAQLEQKAMQEVLAKSNIRVAETGMLANTSYTNLSKSQRLLKAQQALLISSNEALAASNTAVGTSSLFANTSMSKYGQGIVFAQSKSFAFNKDIIKTTAAMGGVGSAMSLAVANMNKTGAGMTNLGGRASRLTGVINGIAAAVGPFLSKLLKAGLIIGTIIVAVEAWKNNWGGFGDVINKAGVAIGNIHPILKTTMELIAKVGLSIDALIHGDIKTLKSIWVSETKGVAEATEEMSEKQQKALEEAQQAIQEFKDESISALFEISEGDRGEQRDWLKSLGLKGDEKERVKDALDVVEDIGTATQSLHDTLAGMEQIDFLAKIGVIDAEQADDIVQEMVENLQDEFDDLGDDLELEGPAQDMFDNFSEVLDKAADMKGPQAREAITSFLNDNPDFMRILKAKAPTLAAAIEGMITTAAAEVKKSKVVNAFTSGEILFGKGERSGFVEGSAFDKEQKKIQGEAGPFQPFVDSFTKGLEAVKKTVAGADYAAIGNTVRDKMIIPLINQAKLWGTEIMNGLAYVMANFDLGASLTTLGKAAAFTLAAFEDFVAGLLGFKSKEDLFKEIDNFFTFTLPAHIKVSITNVMDNVDPDSLSLEKSGGGPGSGASVGSIVITNWLKSFTNSATWEEAINKVFTPQFWSGIGDRIQLLFDKANPQIKTEQDTGKGIHEGGSVGSTVITEWLKNFTDKPTWDTALTEIFNPDFWTQVGKDIQKKFEEANPQFTAGQFQAKADKKSVFEAVALPWLEKTWADFIKSVTENVYVKAFASWINDPLGSMIVAIQNAVVTVERAKADYGIKIPTADDIYKQTGLEQFFTNVDTLYNTTVSKLKEYASTVGKFITDPVGFAMSFWEGQKGSGSMLDNFINKGQITVPENYEDLQNSLGGGDTQYDSELTGSHLNNLRFQQMYAHYNSKKNYGNYAYGTDPFGSGGITTVPGDAGGSGIPVVLTGDRSQKGRQGIKDPYGSHFLGSYGGTGMKTSPILTQMKAQMSGAGMFKPLIDAAASASKGIQTVFSTMWTAVTQIIQNIAVQGTKSFNTLTQNAAGVINMLAAHWSEQGAAMIATGQSVGQVIYESLNQALQNVAGVITMLAAHWSEQGVAMIETGTSVTEVMYDTFITFTDNVAGLMNMLGEHWSMHMNKMGANAESGGEQITEALESAMDDIMSAMEDAGKEWSKQCNAMGANARSAAKQIKNAFDFKVTTIHEIKTIRTGGSLAKGGLVSLAEGGPISAATGKLLTTSGPTYLIGDNPGGRESIWAIPHNNPAPTVSKINKYHGTGGSSRGGDSIWNQTIRINVKGSDLVNETKIDKKIRTTIGDKRDRFG